MVNRKTLVATLVVLDLALSMSLAVFAAGTRNDVIPQVAPTPPGGGLSCMLSASTVGTTATFSGNISGNLGNPTWTLHFGDGFLQNGFGTTVSAQHVYGGVGTYYPYLNATDNQIPASTSCNSNPVVIGRQLSLGVNEAMSVNGAEVLVPPLHVNEVVDVLDALGSALPLTVLENITISEIVQRLVPPLAVLVIESITISEIVQPLGPLTVLENFIISEIVQRLAAIPSLLVNETVGVGDSNPGPFPPGVGESARFSDQVFITQGSNNPFGAFPGGVVGIIVVGVVAGVGVLAVVWKFVLPRRMS